MLKKNCEICGCDESGQLKQYYIVPQAINEQADIQRPETVSLCASCHQELGMWYSAKVSDITFDTTMKQFISKSPSQMVKEYEVAYQWFVNYRKEQLNRP
ncbi:hypothetical protein ACFLVJ_00855 [Chloroflexota bacterium]